MASEALGAAKAMNDAIRELRAEGLDITGGMSIYLSGHSGGTGAAAQNSIMYSAEPWEPHLPEVRKILNENGFGHVGLAVDGGMRSGRDMAYGLALGADKIGFGTLLLNALGCINQGQCHTGDCATGVATNKQNLIDNHFKGEKKHMVRMARYLVRELREVMASVGVRHVNELGPQHLENLSDKRFGFDFQTMLDAAQAARDVKPKAYPEPDVQEPRQHIDVEILENHPDLLDIDKLKENPVIIDVPDVQNTSIATGARIAGALSLKILERTRDFDEQVLPEDSIVIKLHDTPGYATAGYLPEGVTLIVDGIAGDSFATNTRKGKAVILYPSGTKLDADIQQSKVLVTIWPVLL